MTHVAPAYKLVACTVRTFHQAEVPRDGVVWAIVGAPQPLCEAPAVVPEIDLHQHAPAHIQAPALFWR